MKQSSEDELKKRIHLEEEIPLSIFSTPLSPAQALIKYLHDYRKYRFCDIARLANRDQRTIWTIHESVKDKDLKVKENNRTIPLKKIADRNKSILEHVVSHLRSEKMPFKDIAVLLNRKQGTISSTAQRAKRKENE